MLSGFTLQYRGRKYSEKANPDEKSGLDKLRANFSEIGALVIRFHIGQGQRAGLIQQISREDYSSNPVEKPAQGRNQADLFSISTSASHECRETRILEEACHYSLGRGKVLNERAQPLVHINTANFSGEQALWDIIHSPVWNTGITLPIILAKQGFIYVRQPLNMNDSQREKATKEIELGNFEIRGQIETYSGITLETASIKDIKIDLDPDRRVTSQENGLAVSIKDYEEPLGWIVQTKTKKLVSQEHADHLLRVIRIAKGGFYELPIEKQRLLQAGLLKNNGLGLFTQNQAFNAMEVVFQTLENEYGFDPSQLMQDSFLNGATYARVKSLMEDEKSETAEDFLTGILLTEMVQPLRKSQPDSTRNVLPLRFTNPFSVTLNNAKALAYAFDIKRKDGFPVLLMRNDMPDFSSSPDLIDVKINGELLYPELTNPKHTASLLATALLVAEQMLIEQLLKNACTFGSEHPDAVALRKIINDDQMYTQLIALGKDCPQNERGPILGLQFSYCDPIIALLRNHLGFGGNNLSLAEVVNQLCRNEVVDKDLIEKTRQAMEKLFYIGEVLQQLNSTSAAQEQSRGINAGLVPVIGKLAPDLYRALVESGRMKSACDISSCVTSDTKESSDTVSNSISLRNDIDADVCPFLRSIEKSAKEKDIMQSKIDVNVSKNKSQQGNWCNYFARVIPIAAVTVAVSCYVANQII